MTEEKKVLITGTWKVLRPDIRQYKQQSIEVEFKDAVVVEVPVSLMFDVGNGVLAMTPAAMKYVQDQFEKMYAQVAETWDASPTPEVKKEAVTSDDGWGDEPVFDEAPATNQPETEVWDEKEEDWK